MTNTRRVRISIAEIFINDSLIPPPNIQEIFLEIQNLGSFPYNKKILAHFPPRLKEPNLEFNSKIWKNIKTDKHQDPFLLLLVGVTHMKKGKFSKACKDFEEFLDQYAKFVLNSFVIIKLLRCYKREKLFDKILAQIKPDMEDLRHEHKFIVLGFRALCFELASNKAEAENCYKDIKKLDCRASLPCEIWLDMQKEPIKKGLSKKVDNLIGIYNGQAIKDLKLLKAFLFYRKRKIEACIGILTSILRNNRNVKICLSLLGKIFFEKNELRYSAKYYLLALKMGKSSPENWFNLYKVYEECKVPEAAKLIERAKKLDNGDSRILDKSENDLINVHINFAKFLLPGESGSQTEKFGVVSQGVEEDAKLICQLKEKQPAKKRLRGIV